MVGTPGLMNSPSIRYCPTRRGGQHKSAPAPAVSPVKFFPGHADLAQVGQLCDFARESTCDTRTPKLLLRGVQTDRVEPGPGQVPTHDLPPP